jgi:hypothetical protein
VAVALQDSSERVGETALATLAGLGAREAVPDIVRALKKPDVLTRRTALRALGWLESKASLPEILGGLRDADASVREASVAALGDLRARESASRIVELLDDPDRGVRGRAALVLGMLDAGEAVPGIARLLQDDAGEVRRAAAEALCFLGAREGVSALLEQAALSSGAGLGALNALRRRETWRRLREIQVKGREVLEAVSRGAGLGIDAAALGPSEKPAPECFWFPPWEGPSNGADLLKKMPFEAILEADRIRMVPAAQAADFWKEWWDKEREKE